MRAAPLQPTPADLANWRKLVEAAKGVASRAPRMLDPMIRAHAQCYRARFPDQSAETKVACVRLLGLAEDWPRMGAEDRIHAAGGLMAAAEAVERLIDSAGQGPPRLPFRADIDG